MPQPYEEISAGALDGVLDLISMPENMEGPVRFRQHFQKTDGRMARRSGWRRFLGELTQYHNHDLHDQLLPLQLYYADKSAVMATIFPTADCLADLKTRLNGREHITMLYPAVTLGGSRTLFAATQSRIYEFNENIGNWRLLGDGFGGTAPDLTHRFVAAGPVKDVMIFTNNFDKVMSYEIGDEPIGCSIRALKEIDSLNTVKLYKAYEALAFKNTMLLGNVVVDGDRLENWIVSSDLGKALSYDLALTTAADSVASYQELASGHKLLRMLPFGDGALAYTTRGIYKGNSTGNANQPFAWALYYENRDGERCLAYRNTAIQYGNAHYYMGNDAIYKIDNFSDGPEPVDWLNKSAATIFFDINSACCESPCAGVWTHGTGGEQDTHDRELWFSWPKRGSCVPNTTLAIQPENKFVDTVEGGFTCYGTWQSDARPTIADFFRSLCVCDADDVPQVKTGKPKTNPTCAVTPTVFLTHDTVMFDDIEVEDYDAFETAPDSLCAVLNGRGIDDFCLECNNHFRFIAVSSRDKCIKEIGGAFSREYCTNAEVGVGTLDGFTYQSFDGAYLVEGYDSILRLGPISLGKGTIEKTVAGVVAELEAEEELNKHVLALRIGYSYSPMDTNRDGCAVVWTNYVRRYLRCPQSMTPEEYRAKNLRPATGINFPFYNTGRYFYIELIISGLLNQEDVNSQLVSCIGGESYFSSLRLKARRAY